MTLKQRGNSLSNHPWYEEAIFYHIYPLGLTGAPKQNSYGEVEHRLLTLLPWVSHIAKLGFTGLYIGPLFESVGHGYETTDYRKVDSRLGTNEDLRKFVDTCHGMGIKVILDGVFNHTGRDFFAFQDLKRNRENSAYKDWYCNVNFWGNNSFDDGFSYENWGGYDLLVKLNQKNPAVRDYICDVVEFWVHEFDIDGIRLDAADVLDFEFMGALRQKADTVKPDFWLMGEVIHGDYTRWVNKQTLHSVTNYQLHKALYSGHNDHNYFEIAHTIKYLQEKFSGRLQDYSLYNFVDNHDVERIYTKLNEKEHMVPVHILLYTLKGVPSVYYGSEFGIMGKKERGSDDSLRPALDLQQFEEALLGNGEAGKWYNLIQRLGEARRKWKGLSFGDFRELHLSNRQYAFSRTYEGQTVIVTVNNDSQSVHLDVPIGESGEYVGLLSGQRVEVLDGHMNIIVPGNGGEIWVPCTEETLLMQPNQQRGQCLEAAKEQPTVQPASQPEGQVKEQSAPQPEGQEQEEPQAQQQQIPWDIPYEEMTIAQLQQVIYAKMKANGPVTDRMYQDIMENVYHDSLVTWAKSF